MSSPGTAKRGHPRLPRHPGDWLVLGSREHPPSGTTALPQCHVSPPGGLGPEKPLPRLGGCPQSW